MKAIESKSVEIRTAISSKIFPCLFATPLNPMEGWVLYPKCGSARLFAYAEADPSLFSNGGGNEGWS